VLGLVVWAIGSIGMLFGRLIQAAISRQREFLADAAAGQYTRNPNGIAGALAKIRDHSARVASPKASELNHFFFASTLNTLFATHPPIDRRIEALKAMGAMGIPERARPGSADAANRMYAVRAEQRRAASAGAMPAAGFTGAEGTGAEGTVATSGLSTNAAVAGLTGAGAIEQAGTLDAGAIAAAAAWRASLPAALVDAAHESVGARAICYAIARRAAGHAACDTVVAERDRDAYAEYARIADPLARLSGDAQLALAELAAPALTQLGAQGYRTFRETLARAMRSDGSIDLREWALTKCLERHVERRLAQVPSQASRTLAGCASETRTVLGVIAGLEHTGDDVTASFNRAYSALGMQAPTLPPTSERTLDALNAAVAKLAELRFTDRARFLTLAARAAAHDDRVGESEHLVLRAVADALDVPIPALARKS